MNSELTTNNIKFISGFVILLLPLLYYLSNNLYKKRLIHKHKLNIFKAEYKEVQKDIEGNQKRIKEIESFDNEKKRIYSIQLQALESNIKIHKEHIRKLEEKIKKL